MPGGFRKTNNHFGIYMKKYSTCVWMDEETDGRMDGLMDVRMCRLTDGTMDGQMNRWMDGWMNKQMDGRMDGWIN